MSAALTTELETYRRVLPDLLADSANVGKYVLIHGETVAGIYPSLGTGLDAGYAQFDPAPFLVKKIVAQSESKKAPRE